MTIYHNSTGHTSDPRTLTAALGGRWFGSYGRARCPACGGKADNPPLAIKRGDKGLLLHCFRGCDYRDIKGALGAYGPTEVNPLTAADAEQQGKADAALAEKKARQAEACWAETKPITGTPAEAYLQARGITIHPGDVRFHPECWHGPTAKRLPAMVGRIRGGDGFGIHRTYLHPEGRKADVRPAKMMLGGAKGGAVRVREAFGPLLVGEGIESVLSAISALPDVGSAWAALSTSGLMSVTLPRKPGELIVAVDGDDAGRKAGQSLARRATAAGWKVSNADPGDGLDFNDLVSA